VTESPIAEYLIVDESDLELDDTPVVRLRRTPPFTGGLPFVLRDLTMLPKGWNQYQCS